VERGKCAKPLVRRRATRHPLPPMPEAPQDAPLPALPTHDAYAAFRSPSYRAYALSGLISILGRQMMGMALAYEIYERTHSKTALGLVGLMGALPIILLSIPAGIAADRFSRKGILLITQAVAVLTSIGLAALAYEHVAVPSIGWLGACTQALYSVAGWFGEGQEVFFEPAMPVMYLLLFINGIARAFGWAARSALFPSLVPRSALSNAVMWNSSTFELTCVVGPGLGGLAIAAFGVPVVYAIDAACGLAGLAILLPIHVPPPASASHLHPWRDLFTGLRFVYGNKIILGAVTLDMFAVLLGGATALLPAFAKEILGVGAVGLGWLRAAPSFGAVLMAFALAHRPPIQRAGHAMLLAVAGFGAATIVFGLSTNYALSFIALAITGACDNISVVVRHTLVQLLTPDAMRGRVSAVNNIFIGSSNELGALESGLTGAWFGLVRSVVGGGIGTILVVLGIVRKWPELLRTGPLQAPEKLPESTD
jgi:MFS family permease